MKFFDSFKMALHNLWHNKSRSILTVVIVFVVSVLIMAMCLIGTNFSTNMTAANMMQFETGGTEYFLNNKSQKYDPNDHWDKPENRATTEEALQVFDISKKYKDVVDSGYYNAGENGKIEKDGASMDIGQVGFASFDLSFSEKIGTVIEGRIWTAADENTNNAWVDIEVISTLAANGVGLTIGDTFTLSVKPETIYTMNDRVEGEFTAADFVLAGIIKNDSSANSYNSVSLYVNGKYSSSAYPLTKIKNLNLRFEPVVGGYNFRTAEKRMKALVQEVNAAVGPGIDYQGASMVRFSCEILETLKMTTLMSLIIMVVIVFLAFMILILSIGSVANTIIISVDKNRKFIGLMKAMGLNNKGVKGIVYKEAFVTITIGIGLAVALIYLLKGVMVLLIDKIMGSMFGALELVTTFSISVFVPIVTLLAFIGFAVLFSKGSLNKMGKADVISVISEVA